MSGTEMHVAVDLGGEAPVMLETGRHVGDVVFGLDDWFAAIACFQLRQLGRTATNDAREVETKSRPRSCADVSDHGPPSNAARAAATAF